MPDSRPPAIHAERIALTEDQRRQRLRRAARVLVRTMNSCPAPGVAPLTVRDWLLIAAAVLLPYLLVFGLAALTHAQP